MNNLEIERKFLVKKDSIPYNLKNLKSKKIIQGFIYFNPAIRVRRVDNEYFLTIKSKPNNYKEYGDLVRNEYEISIGKNAFNDLLKLCVGKILYKRRYYIPYKYGKKTYIIELDIFEKDFKGLIYAEIEFENVKNAYKIKVPDWFFKEVTNIRKYKNTELSICKNIKNVLKY
ncbi:MAG: CYTH domain-containing protein [Lachnospiraceae bacterium]|nr:CYTH domain-containing protein [Lachnospiraceae bacterium]